MKLFLLLILACTAVVAIEHNVNQGLRRRRTIANGNSVTLYRYFTLLSDTQTGAGTKRCAGVLIHQDIVASSASCIYEQFVRFNNLPIVARTDYRTDSFSTSTHFVGTVSNAPGYSPNSPSPSNDLVLLRLNTTSDIPVPLLNQNFMAPETLQVVGAGATIDGGAWSSTLLQADMLVQQFEACAATYKALDNRANLNKKKQFCAGRRPGVAGGPCAEADHGAPLMDTRGGNTNASAHVLMGIASFGNGCGPHAPPFVFTRIRTYYAWIRLELCRLTASPPPYCFTGMPSLAPSESPSLQPTQTLESPYFVVLSDVARGTGSVRCGGVLIHSDIVLTADSCTDGRLNFARIGFNEEGLEPLAVRAIAGILPHPSSTGLTSRGNYPANLALIRLSSPVTNVQPIAINIVGAIPPDNGADVVFVSAGDATSTDGSTATFHDKAVTDDLQTSNFNVCSSDYKGRQVTLDESVQFCAGVNEKGAGGPCGEGDFGGPLVIKGGSSNGDLLVGIASPPGVGCGPQDPAFTFTRISTYATWIEEQLCFFSFVGPDRCVTSSPSISPSQAPTPNPTKMPTPRPTTATPTPFPTSQPTTGTPTVPPTTPAPTDACRDQPGGVLFTIENGASMLQPCSWLNESEERKSASCAPGSSTSAATLCELSCGLCTRTPTSAPIEIPSGTTGPTSSCSDNRSAQINVEIAGVNVMEPCSYLAARPALISVLCSPDHSSGAFDACTSTCGRCTAPITASPIQITTPPVTLSPVTAALTPAPVDSLTPAPLSLAPLSLAPLSLAPLSLAPLSLAPTSIECADSNTTQLAIIFLGFTTLQSCQYLIDNPFIQISACDPASTSGALTECRQTCGSCLEESTPTTPTPVTQAPVSPPPVTASPSPLPTLSPVSPPTPSPVMPSTPCEDDSSRTFFVIFDNIATIENCQFLQENPQLIIIECDVGNALSVARNACPKTCGVCE